MTFPIGHWRDPALSNTTSSRSACSRSRGSGACKLAAAVGALALVVASSPALAATPLPDAIYYLSGEAYTGPSSAITNFSDGYVTSTSKYLVVKYGYKNSVISAATAQFNTSPSQLVSATAQSNVASTPYYGAVSTAILAYAVEIEGPTSFLTPISISYADFGSSTQPFVGAAVVLAQLGFGYLATTPYVDESGIHYDNDGSPLAVVQDVEPGSFSNKGTITTNFYTGGTLEIYTNTVYWMFIEAAAGADEAVASAWMDPYIQLSPTLGPDYSLDLSPGITNNPLGPDPEPGVPEPTTWALMLVGFTALGAILRESRRCRSVQRTG